ncbi:MAG: 5-formyltetrahydrofolate cyclo-ligase [Chlorobiaceae bacterium]|jgi:5-formyltetrahydrofolate cyclo-ligase|nr:5-formyltetrahydrofolate cyclo-ligase [Chlorobiaceae bacterium]
MNRWKPMDGNAGIAVEKEGVRAGMIARRGMLPEETRRAMSMVIAGYVKALPEVISARHIHVYLSIPGQAEVSTVPILEALDAMGKELSVPVIQKSDLFSAAYRKGDPVRLAQFGQPEPEAVVKVDESCLDVVLMPLVAFDRNGYRVGYGKGFYDRFLHRLLLHGIRPCRIGLAFSMQMVDAVLADPWDVPLDGAVHELGIIRFNANL